MTRSNLLATLLPFLALSLGVGACESTVVGGGDDGGGGDGVDVTSSSAGNTADDDDGESTGYGGSDGNDDGTEPDPVTTGAIGYRVEMGDSYGLRDNFTTVGQGGPPQEDRFVVSVANHELLSCSDPYASPACPAEVYQVSVSIPESRAFVGATIDLTDPTIFVSMSEQGVNIDAEDCWYGGGAGPMEGTLTLVSAGQGTMDVTFANTGDSLVEGTHSIVVCN